MTPELPSWSEWDLNEACLLDKNRTGINGIDGEKLKSKPNHTEVVKQTDDENNEELKQLFMIFNLLKVT